jgi:adenosylcobinamide-GDP ribazoletransferase
VACVILLIGYIVCTGGIHLDGLSDTCDGLFSGRERARVLEIMKDSRSGTFGILSLICICLLYFALFGYVTWQALLLFPVAGKAACMVSSSMAPYARAEGMGKVNAQMTGRSELLWSLTWLGLACLLVFPLTLLVSYIDSGAAEVAVMDALINTSAALVAAAASCAAAALITVYVRRRIGGVTGDTMGAACEVCGAVFLLFYYVILAIAWR